MTDLDPSKPAPIKQAAWFHNTDASSIGIEIVVAIAVPALVGHYIETHYTHWAPWTTLLFIAFGLTAATRAVIRTTRNVLRVARENDAKQAEQEDA